MREIVKVGNVAIIESEHGEYLIVSLEPPYESWHEEWLSSDEVRRLSYALSIWLDRFECRDRPVKAQI